MLNEDFHTVPDPRYNFIKKIFNSKAIYYKKMLSVNEMLLGNKLDIELYDIIYEILDEIPWFYHSYWCWKDTMPSYSKEKYIEKARSFSDGFKMLGKYLSPHSFVVIYIQNSETQFHNNIIQSLEKSGYEWL
jgi:hypothetical protein